MTGSTGEIFRGRPAVVMSAAEEAKQPGSMLARAPAWLTRVLSAPGGAAASLQTLVASVLILGLNLSTGMLTARLLGPVGRGELAAIIVWPQFMAFILTLGLPSSLLYNLKCHPERDRELFTAVVLLSCLTGSVAALTGAQI